MPKRPLASVPVNTTWHWQEQGRCREVENTSIFFHPPNERGLARIRRDEAAVAVCAACPVRVQCADYALRSREPYGVWGGLTEEDRRKIFRKTSMDDFPRQRGEAAKRFAAEIAAAVPKGSQRQARTRS